MLEKNEMREICERYYCDVFRFSLHFLRDDEKAKDITQDTFLLLNEKSQKLNNENIKSWLFSTAYRKIQSERRNIQKALKSEVLNEEILPEGGLVEEELVRENILKYSTEAISSLSEKDRELYCMRFAENLSFSEISGLLGESENTVCVRVHRLREKVIKYIREKILM